jgi:hypothetical protein
MADNGGQTRSLTLEHTFYTMMTKQVSAAMSEKHSALCKAKP